ncbi:MAG: band 7 protein [Candidatus Rokuibacteriota bacterium]|nr:MAG: band 7 protein [Candidatus Rokubacteria bacterium]PYN55548.1 MAG: band 7 protein [Candidatus Rokubacteria bacterium]
MWLVDAFLAHWFLYSLAGVVVLFLLRGIRYIPNTKVGLVEKRTSGKGSVSTGIIALNGEAGFQPALLRGGVHYLLPGQYKIHIHPLVTIPQGKIGYVFARDGVPLPPTQALASNAVADDLQDAAAFLQNGGQRGPQRKILREGTYAVNLAQFVVITTERVYFLPLEKSDEEIFQRMTKVIQDRAGFDPVVIKGTDDLVGIVTVHDGPSLPPGQIIAPTVGDTAAQPDTYHNSFQDPERFLRAGGQRGRQLQVLVEGTYYINRLFATVEMVPKTVIEVGNVGVVVSYTGETGEDLSGAAYKHGELVQKGLRGVWSEPLLPGKYAFNTYAGKVFLVPTTNFILKWNKQETGSHKYDENLAEVALITKDAFEPSLPLSVVVHIDYRKAPLVIQRFGDIKRLVEQTLDPMVSAYFKNVGQTRTLIQLLQDRSAIQQLSGDQMKEKFDQYNLELQEVLIGTPTSGQGGGQIEQILTQLRSRQIAEEQVETYNRQEKAAVKERELREAEARAKQQTTLTESELYISIQTNQGKADYARAQQQAAQIQTLAQAEAEKIRILGEGEAKKVQALAGAEAERAARVGIAQAMAIDEQVRAYGGPRFQLTQQVMSRFAEAIEAARVDIVPKIMIHGGGGNGTPSTGSVMEALLTLLLADRMGADATPNPATPRSAAAEAVRSRIEQGLKEQR